MKKLILSLIVFGALLHPSFAGGRHGGGSGGHSGFGHGGHGGHEHFGFNHERHEGWRGAHGRFHGFNGTFYGQIIILDDGCYFWDGLVWELIDCD
jgi:hypothetical protein